MTTEEIANRLTALPAKLTGASWGFAFLQCYQGTDSKLPKSIFDRVKAGSANAASDPDREILWKKRIFFQWVDRDVRAALAEAKSSALIRSRINRPMFILVASAGEIAAHDLDSGEDLVIVRDELPSVRLFLPAFRRAEEDHRHESCPGGRRQGDAENGRPFRRDPEGQRRF